MIPQKLIPQPKQTFGVLSLSLREYYTFVDSVNEQEKKSLSPNYIPVLSSLDVVCKNHRRQLNKLIVLDDGYLHFYYDDIIATCNRYSVAIQKLNESDQ